MLAKSKLSKNIVAATMLLLSVFFNTQHPKVYASMVCSGQEDWFLGYTTDVDIRFNVFEVHMDDSKIAVGGARQSQNAAVIVILDFGSADTIQQESSREISSFNALTGPTIEYKNVAAIQFNQKDSDQVFVVFELTDTSGATATEMVFLLYDYAQGIEEYYRLASAAVKYSYTIFLAHNNDYTAFSMLWKHSSMSQTYRLLSFDPSNNSSIRLETISSDRLVALAQAQYFDNDIYPTSTLMLVVHQASSKLFFRSYDTIGQQCQMEISVSPGSSLTSSYSSSVDDYQMIGRDKAESNIAATIFTAVVSPDFYIFYLEVDDILTNGSTTCVTSPLSINQVSISNADSISMSQLSVRRSNYNVNIFLLVSKPGGVEVQYLLENYDGVTVSNNQFVKFQYAGNSLTWLTGGIYQSKVGINKNLILVSTKKILRFNTQSSSSASYCSKYDYSTAPNTDYTLTNVDSTFTLVDVTSLLTAPFVVINQYLSIASDIDYISTHSSILSSFDLSTERGYMENPCEIEVPPFESNSVDIPENVSSQTIMSARVSFTLATAPEYYCPGATTASNPAYVDYSSQTYLEITSVSTVSNGWIGSASLADYALVNGQDIELQQSGPADWIMGTHQVEYLTGFPLSTTVNYSSVSPQYVNFEVTACTGTLNLPSPWPGGQEYIYSSPTLSTQYSFTGASMMNGCTFTTSVFYEEPYGSTSYLPLTSYDPATMTFNLYLTGTSDKTLRFMFLIMEADNTANYAFDYYTIDAKYCPMTLPSSLQSSYSFDLSGSSQLVIPSDAPDNGQCGTSILITLSDGTALPFEPFTTDADSLTVSPSSNQALAGQIHSFVYSMTSNNSLQQASQSPTTFNFDVELVWLSTGCSPSLALTQLADVTLDQGDPVATEIDLSAIASNNDCRFVLELLDGGLAIDEGLFELTQAQFTVLEEVSGGDNDQVAVSEPALLSIIATSYSQVGTHNMQLKIIDASQPLASASYTTIDFTVTINGCINIDNAVNQASYDQIEYRIGDDQIQHYVVSSNFQCPNSQFSVTMQDDSDLPEFIQIDVSTANQAMVSVYTELMTDKSTYVLEVLEKDLENGNEKLTIVQIDVDEPLQSEVIIQEEEEEEEQSSQNEEIVVSEEVEEELNEFFFDPEQYRAQRKVNITVTEDPIPLRASVLGLSDTGNLTIVFNKPVYLPPIEIYQLDEKSRLLESSYTIQEVLSVSVDSAFHEDDSPETRIDDYKLTRMTETAMDVQIDFNMPGKITRSKIEPDILQIAFTEQGRRFFTDQQDLTQLQVDNLFLATDIQPQLTLEEKQEIEALESQLTSSFDSFSSINMIVNIFLAAGLRYLWNMIALLQFVVFMREWQIVIPIKTQTWLKQIKSLALLEFLPTQDLDDRLFVFFGIDRESTNQTLDSEEDESLFDKLAVFIILGFAIFLLVILFVICKCLIKVCEKLKKCYEFLKNKLYYGVFIRFIMLGTLKIQLTLCRPLFIGSFIQESAKDVKSEDLGTTIAALTALIAFSLSPLLFGCVLWRNRKRLQEPEVKTKIGAMYFGLNEKKPRVSFYSIVFLLRRSAFIAVTFLLFARPGLQVEFMAYPTLAYICFISHLNVHETPRQKNIEMMNEVILVGICYHFILFADPIWDEDLREAFGTSVVGFVLSLLGINTLIIIVVNIQTIRRKCYLCKLKKQAEKRNQERIAKMNDQMRLKSLQAKNSENFGNQIERLNWWAPADQPIRMKSEKGGLLQIESLSSKPDEAHSDEQSSSQATRLVAAKLRSTVPSQTGSLVITPQKQNIENAYESESTGPKNRLHRYTLGLKRYFESKLDKSSLGIQLEPKVEYKRFSAHDYVKDDGSFMDKDSQMSMTMKPFEQRVTSLPNPSFLDTSKSLRPTGTMTPFLMLDDASVALSKEPTQIPTRVRPTPSPQARNRSSSLSPQPFVQASATPQPKPSPKARNQNKTRQEYIVENDRMFAQLNALALQYVDRDLPSNQQSVSRNTSKTEQSKP